MSAPSIDKEIVLPFFSRLGVTNPPKDVDPSKVVAEWSPKFFEALSSNNVEAVVSLFSQDGMWRDTLALTWDFRTILKPDNIRRLLNARLGQTKITNVRLSDNKAKQASMVNTIPNLLIIRAYFDFETAIGLCSGVFQIVPDANGDWKLFIVFTNLDELKGFPPRTGLNRPFDLNPGPWASRRAEEIAFEHREPTVLVVGGGHAGLSVAARLKCQGVSCLVIEKNGRIGDSWRNRYDTLSLHDSVWYASLPYLSYPSSWPVFAPAGQFADWLESYALSLELNVWTSSEVISIKRDDDVKGDHDQWLATVRKADGSHRIFRIKHVVLAFGLFGGPPNIPKIPGMDEFKGSVLHSTQYKRASDYKGKEVVVIGACTSAHDIAQDCQQRGVDVTLIQRSSTCVVSVAKGLPYFLGTLYSENGRPVEFDDLLNNSIPVYAKKRFHELAMHSVRKADREIREGLQKVGFQINDGPDDSGFIAMAWEKGGGYYLDVGASQLIADGKIKFKHGNVKNFTKDSLVFEDGSTLKADVVVCATGYGDARDAAKKFFPGALADKIKPLWGLTREGEMRGIYTECGLPNVYIVMGNIAQCRFYSTHIALQIKAKEEGLYSTVYEG